MITNLLPDRYRLWANRAYKKAWNFGIRYKCPFCNSSLRAFLPFGYDFPVLKRFQVVGGGRRLNARCPVCGALDRERLLFLYLVYKTGIFSHPHRILHIAPEPTIHVALRTQTDLQYITADLIASDVMLKIDITNIPFRDDHFDAAICNHVLEHIVDDGKAMAELYRVLKPSGWAILQVPISPLLDNTYEDFSITEEYEREQAFGQKDHVRIYAKDYMIRLERTGFRVDIFDWTTEPANFGGYRNRFGLNRSERVYMVKKC